MAWDEFFADLTDEQVGQVWARSMRELRDRDLIRSWNNPVADLCAISPQRNDPRITKITMTREGEHEFYALFDPAQPGDHRGGTRSTSTPCQNATWPLIRRANGLGRR